MNFFIEPFVFSKKQRVLIMNSNKLQIIELLQSGVDENIDLALLLIDGQGLKKSFNRRYGKLCELTGRSLKGLFTNEYLDLSKCGLKHIPEGVFDLVHLEFLYLCMNQIQEIPENVKNLKKLKSLFVRRNNLTNLPKTLGDLCELQVLDLSNNQITEIPKELSSIEPLKILKLLNNKLTNIPNDFGNMPNLKYFEY